MKLSELAINSIKASASAKKELVYHLANTSTTLYRWLDSNEENGTLTTFRAVEIIKEQTGLKQSEILTKI